MYKMFALIVLLAAPVLVTLVDSLVPKTTTVAPVSQTGPDDNGEKAKAVSVPPPVTAQPGMSPAVAGMATLDTAGFDPKPMLATGPVTAPAPISSTPIVQTDMQGPPPPPGLAQSNDDHP